MNEPPADAAVRAELLDPRQSFIVRAPAGSGKTELLVRRVLGLLATVDTPEQIVAITFTRKAAAEMRQRVLAALSRAAGGAVADEAGRLAATALDRDRALGWGLLDHPARLRIGTIDAFVRSVAAMAPEPGGSSGLRRSEPDAGPFYEAAAREALDLVGSDGPAGQAAADLLRHLDGRLGVGVRLLAGLLARRDQWLPLIGAGPPTGANGSDGTVGLRARLEAALQALVRRRLQHLARSLGDGLAAEFESLTRSAAATRGTPLAPAAPGDLDAGREFWLAARATWLTKEGGIRARLTKEEGFPPADRGAKTRAQELLRQLAGRGEFRAALARPLPEPRYPETQWQALQALLTLLPTAAALLRLRLAESGSTDFIEVAGDALRLLGDCDADSGVAERLDARLQHLLMDEFQDTSRAQHALLLALTRGFVPGDGRTVFLVGDPMQSIYRFRESDVGLFMQLAAEPPHGLPIAARTLTSNFRSAPALVDWVNRVFQYLLPAADDVATGAVSFAGATATRATSPGDGVVLHAPGDSAAEAEVVVALVKAALQERPGGSIGILVRSRAHAAPTLLALERAGIAVSQVDLRLLAGIPVVEDLLSLTRALVHPADRLAWLAILRAPWCGLSLADLEALAGSDPAATIPELLADPVSMGRLSPDGRARAARLAAAVASGQARAGELDLRDRVEGVWTELGGPAVADCDPGIPDALFALLDDADTGGDCPDPDALAEALAGKTVPGRGGSPIEVLTIHKAKGLEFDTVIVPGLHGAVARDQRSALLWHRDPRDDAVLLAPINAAGHNQDPLYEFLWSDEQRRASAEQDRLLYVACTRARHALHLLGTPGNHGPGAGTLLARLWDAVPGGWPPVAATATPTAPTANDGFPGITLPLRRLPSGWQRPAVPPAAAGAYLRPPPPASEPFSAGSDRARRTGIVLHRLLQHVTVMGSEAWDDVRIAASARLVAHWLRGEGLEPAAIDEATSRVLANLRRTLQDAKGRWVLSGQHPDSASEYALMAADGPVARRLVVDRTFRTTAGERWIIDYKSALPAGSGSDAAASGSAWVDSQMGKHAAQLEAYRRAWTAMEPGRGSVRVALYLPELPRLVELR